MQTGLSLADWLARLETLAPNEIDLGLERVTAVIERLAPELPAQVLTVGGTNGKGSTVAMSDAILRAAGYRVGAYTSPHILRFNERIRVDGEDAGDAAIVRGFERVEAVRGDIRLTYFEFTTIAALLVFEDHAVDVAILEVGMGGRLDAVNAVDPTASLVTNVALDHCSWLGNDVETIAGEKAGIMRAGRPVIYAGAQVPAAITRNAAKAGARLVLAGRDYEWTVGDSEWSWEGPTLALGGLVRPALRGPIQLRNAAGVLALLSSAGFDDDLSRTIVNTGLSGTRLPGRMQEIRNDRQWLLDVGHNPAAAGVLADALAQDSCAGKTIGVIAMLDDKDVEQTVAALAPAVDRWIAFPASGYRSIPVAELARRVANATGRACLECRSAGEALDAAVALSTATDRILVTGSFYGVGPALEELELYSRRKSVPVPASGGREDSDGTGAGSS